MEAHDALLAPSLQPPPEPVPPAPFTLLLFEEVESARPPRARRPRPYRRVLGVVLGLSPTEQRRLLREVRSRMKGNPKEWI